MSQDGDKEIHFDNGNHPDRVRGRQAGQPFKDYSGMVLISALVQSEAYILKNGYKFGPKSEYPINFRPDLSKVYDVQITRRRDDDAMFRRENQTGF
jgi:hypothetical protein